MTVAAPSRGRETGRALPAAVPLSERGEQRALPVAAPEGEELALFVAAPLPELRGSALCTLPVTQHHRAALPRRTRVTVNSKHYTLNPYFVKRLNTFYD